MESNAGSNDAESELLRSEGTETSTPSADGSEKLRTVPLWIQVVWVCSGLIFLIAHVLKDAKKVEDLLHPVTDTQTAVFLVFTILGLLVNSLAEIGIPGGGKLKFRAVEAAANSALESAREFEIAAGELAQQIQSWAESVNLLNHKLSVYGTSAERIDNIVAQYCLSRMEEAAELLAFPGEKVRLSIWWWIKSELGLRLLLSNEIRDQDTWDFVFEPLEGLMGEAFVEARQFNLKDATKSPQFITIRQETEYRGLLLTPIVDGQRRIMGMLSIDRTRAAYFDSVAENIALALVSLIAQAYTHPTVRAALPEMLP